MEVNCADLSTFLTQKRIKKVSKYILDHLKEENCYSRIISESQLSFVIPILTSSLESGSDAQLIDDSLEVVCQWMLKFAPGKENSLRNKYIRYILEKLLSFCRKNNNFERSKKIIAALKRIVLEPPCFFENSTWDMIILLLPLFAETCSVKKQNEKLSFLSFKAYICAGELSENSKKLLINSPVSMAWRRFIGDMIAATVSPKWCRPSYFTKGVWSEEKPVSNEYIRVILESAMKKNMDDSMRRLCFYGLAVSLSTSSYNLIKFNYPIDTQLSVFATVLFPLSQIESDYFPIVFDFFANGSMCDQSKWMNVLKTEILVELRRKDSDPMSLISGMSTLFVSRSDFCLQFCNDMINAIQNEQKPPIDVEKWSTLCLTLAELSISMNNSNSALSSLSELCLSRIPVGVSVLTQLFIALVNKSPDQLAQIQSFCTDFRNPIWLLYEAYSPHFSQSIVTVQSIETRVAQQTQFQPQKNLFMLLLLLIETIGTIESLRSNTVFMLYVNDSISKCFNEFPYLKGLLLNLISTPIQHQLSYYDLKGHLDKPMMYIRYNNSIITATYEEDETAIVISRNLYSMSAYNLRPSRPVQVIEETSSPIEAKSSKFTPYHPEKLSKTKHNTFSFLTSLGLFTYDNKNSLSILEDNEVSIIKDFEGHLGKYIIPVTIIRISNHEVSDLINNHRTSSKFNTFTSLLGKFKKEFSFKGKISKFPVPYFDTVLFRIAYLSPSFFCEKDRTDIDLSKNSILVVFNESPSQLMPKHKLLQNYDIVISFTQISPCLFNMWVLKKPSDYNLPQPICGPRIICSSNIGVELSFIVFVFQSLNVSSFVKYREDFHRGVFKNFKTDDGIELLSNVLKRLSNNIAV